MNADTGEISRRPVRDDLMEGEFPATVKVLAAVQGRQRATTSRTRSRAPRGSWRRTSRRPTSGSSTASSTASSSGTRRRQEGRGAVQERQRRRGVLQEEFPAKLKELRDAVGGQADADGRLLRLHAVAGGRAVWAWPTTTASITAGSSPPTCARWARRCRRSTAAAPTSRCRAAELAAGIGRQ